MRHRTKRVLRRCSCLCVSFEFALGSHHAALVLELNLIGRAHHRGRLPGPLSFTHPILLFISRSARFHFARTSVILRTPTRPTRFFAPSPPLPSFFVCLARGTGCQEWSQQGDSPTLFSLASLHCWAVVDFSLALKSSTLIVR